MKGRMKNEGGLPRPGSWHDTVLNGKETGGIHRVTGRSGDTDGIPI